MAFTIVSAIAFQFLLLPHTFPAGRLVADISRRLTRNKSSRNAATTASWPPIPDRCLAFWKPPFRRQSPSAASAVIVLPGDVALKDAVHGPRVRFHEPKSTVCPSDEELNILAELLNRSEKITILGGAGCAGAHAELIEVAGKLQAPIVHALRGKEFIEYDNPYDVGLTGLLGFSSGYHAMTNCEVLLMLGTDFPYRDFYPKDAAIVQIDLRGEHLGRRSKLDFGFIGDTKTTLRALLPKLEQNQYQEHLKHSVEHYRKTRKDLDDLATSNSNKGPIHPQYVARVIDKLAAEDAVFTCDVGYARNLVRTLSHHERKTASDRFLQPWINGQRIAGRHWGAGCLSRPSGHFNVG